jgi:hypothetical protein
MYVAKTPHVIAQASRNHSLLAALELNSLTIFYIRRLSSQLLSPQCIIHQSQFSTTQSTTYNLYTTLPNTNNNQINNSSSHKLIPELYPITWLKLANLSLVGLVIWQYRRAESSLHHTLLHSAKRVLQSLFESYTVQVLGEVERDNNLEGEVRVPRYSDFNTSKPRESHPIATAFSWSSCIIRPPESVFSSA